MVVNTDEAAAAVVQSLANVNATKAVAQDAADALKKGTDEAKTAREKVKEAEANAETARGAEKAAADDLTDKHEAATLAFAAQATLVGDDPHVSVAPSPMYLFAVLFVTMPFWAAFGGDGAAAKECRDREMTGKPENVHLTFRSHEAGGGGGGWAEDDDEDSPETSKFN